VGARAVPQPDCLSQSDEILQEERGPEDKVCHQSFARNLKREGEEGVSLPPKQEIIYRCLDKARPPTKTV